MPLDGTIRACPSDALIVIAGAEDHYLENPLFNRLMFLAQAIRLFRTHGAEFQIRVLFYFNSHYSKETPSASHSEITYSDAQVKALIDSAAAYGVELRNVTTWQEVAAYINLKSVEFQNQRLDKCVKQLVFFSHGTPNSIWLASQEKKFLTESELGTVDSSAFNNDARIVVWACQTGNSGEAASTTDTILANSLAQKMSTTWNVNVVAAVTRVDYSHTWSKLPIVPDRVVPNVMLGRSVVDGAIWKKAGADHAAVPGTSCVQDSHNIAVPHGMILFTPNQKTAYKAVTP